MDPSVFSLLRCPNCRSDTLSGDAHLLVCDRCDHRYPKTDQGYYDLLQTSAAGVPAPPTPAQRLMESELVARVYERFWRPAMVRLMAGKGAAGAAGGFSGEFFIHKNALGMDDRQGPWLDLSCGPGLFTRAMAAMKSETVSGLAGNTSRAWSEHQAVKTAVSAFNALSVFGDMAPLAFLPYAARATMMALRLIIDWLV